MQTEVDADLELPLVFPLLRRLPAQHCPAPAPPPPSPTPLHLSRFSALSIPCLSQLPSEIADLEATIKHLQSENTFLRMAVGRDKAVRARHKQQRASTWARVQAPSL